MRCDHDTFGGGKFSKSRGAFVDVPHFLSRYDPEPRRYTLTCNLIGAVGTWTKSELPPGQALREPPPLFNKLDESVIEEEYAQLG